MAKTSKKRAKVVKGDIVRMRVTAEQKQAFEEAAAQDGLDVSAWLRQLAVRAAAAARDRK